MKGEEEQNTFCPYYCGLACVDGSCPIARWEEYAERGYDVFKTCAECWMYEGCKDCMFKDTEECIKQCVTVGYHDITIEEEMS